MPTVSRYKPDELEKLRKFLGWTLKDVMLKCETLKMSVSEATLGSWERNETTPDADKLAILAGIFGVGIERFYEESSSK